jgi:hypothetical protein
MSPLPDQIFSDEILRLIGKDPDASKGQQVEIMSVMLARFVAIPPCGKLDE